MIVIGHETVSMTIYQHRDNINTYAMTKDDLYRWAEEELKPLAFAGWQGVPRRMVSVCKAKHDCRARCEHNMELANTFKHRLYWKTMKWKPS